MAKKMTLKQRAEKAALAETGSVHGTYHGLAFADGYIAGWRARGRADATTKAERAVVEAAIKWRFITTLRERTNVVAELEDAVIALTKARSAK